MPVTAYVRRSAASRSVEGEARVQRQVDLAVERLHPDLDPDVHPSGAPQLVDQLPAASAHRRLVAARTRSRTDGSHGPVLHDLRGCLDEVPLGLAPLKRANWARLRLMCRMWPNSWKRVCTSACRRRFGRSPDGDGGVKFATIARGAGHARREFRGASPIGERLHGAVDVGAEDERHPPLVDLLLGLRAGVANGGVGVHLTHERADSYARVSSAPASSSGTSEFSNVGAGSLATTRSIRASARARAASVSRRTASTSTAVVVASRASYPRRRDGQPPTSGSR